MSKLILSSVFLAAVCLPALAANGELSGAPGPIAGAGLPIIAAGYGVYWLIRRRRRKPE